ncbi:MAG: hypothetical protein R2762_21965 [Bryobacteraceae bacterium]
MLESRRLLLLLVLAAPAPAVAADPEIVMHEGQRSFRVKTKSATWIFHAEGAGFASLIDRDGKDWISYRPGNRAAGEFRGIPNLGTVAHPGYEGEKGSRTVAERKWRGVRLRSTSRDGLWATTWDFRRDFARLTVDKAGGPYWVLYEGTPGGKLDVETGYWGLGDGVRRSMKDTWNADIEGQEWVYFGDERSPRVLFLVNHQDDRANDQFWQMEESMTVWGFGRQYRCCGRYMEAAPAKFTVGFVESTDFAKIKKAVERAARAR